MIGEWGQPQDASKRRIEEEVEKDTRNKSDHGWRKPQTEKTSGADRRSKKQKPEQRQVRPVMVMEAPPLIDEIEVEHVEVWKDASD